MTVPLYPQTWDGNDIQSSVYSSRFLDDTFGLPNIDVKLGKREGVQPIIGDIERIGKLIYLKITILGSPVYDYWDQLSQWFDPDDEDPKQLIGTDDLGGSTVLRYVNAICKQLTVIPGTLGQQAIATLQIDGDIKWRRTTTDTLTHDYTSSGESSNFSSVVGSAPAYPQWRITPTTAKTGSWPYKIFIPIRWNVDEAYDNYPIDIADDSLDTQIASTNFALASGDDLRVWVDGSEVNRWLDGPNTSTTKVWINLDWQAQQEFTLDGAIGTGDTTITVNESINNMANDGILVCESEVITYTGKVNQTKKFTGCTRGAYSTTAATHADTTAIWWCQHEIWIVYGNASAGSPPANTNYRPMFNLTSSTNTSWDYDYFTYSKPRSAQWTFVQYLGVASSYTENHGTYVDPAEEIGIYIGNLNSAGYWMLGNPCGITAANFQNGEHWSNVITTIYHEQIYSSPNTGGGDWELEDSITPVTVVETWQSWSDNETLNSGAKAVSLYMYAPIYAVHKLECSDVTLTIDSTYTPTITLGSEQSNYALDCEIYNSATGETIAVAFNMELNQTLQIDSYTKEVTYLKDSSNQFQALTIVGDARRDWLKLLISSNNPIQYTETGMVAVTVAAVYYPRYHQ